MKKQRSITAPLPTVIPKRRCVAYTRVSTEEGLGQVYNSIHSQVDACAAYINSRSADNWEPSPHRYDDGGYSGGTLVRPALRRLLADITAGQVDVVVVYRIDRLSRSVMDCAKLLEIFAAHNVTVTSVTEPFDTTTSAGGLMFNMALGFAQYERELIGERIRHKFAMSRARGIWMGGKPLMGFVVRDRKLIIEPVEAEKVRRVFKLFVETQSGLQTARRLQQESIASKTGRLLDKGDVYKMLNNRTYLGEATHKGNSYPGEHQAIVPQALWDEVHAILQESPGTRSNRARNQTPALLKGLIFGIDGRAMSPTHTRRRGKLY